MRRLLLLILLLPFLPAFARAQMPAADDAESLRRASAALTDIMVHDIFSPPVASRIYLYTSVAAYETMVKAHPQEYASLYGQIKGFPAIAAPVKPIYFPVASVYAFLMVGKRFVFSDSTIQDSIRIILDALKAANPDPELFAASLEYGTQIAKSILSWADGDQYKETRKLARYRFLRQKGEVDTNASYVYGGR